jgi:mannose-6-phosphate isomerase-like protein (cupin superfamily)
MVVAAGGRRLVARELDGEWLRLAPRSLFGMALGDQLVGETAPASDTRGQPSPVFAQGQALLGIGIGWLGGADHARKLLRACDETLVQALPSAWSALSRTNEEAIVPASYTHKKLTDVEDSAAKFGVGEIQEVRFANKDLDAEHTGVSHQRLRPGKRGAFAHKHEQAEEVYVVLSGSGRIKLDDEIVEIEKLDAIRVAPGVIRAFDAGPDGLELLAVGARHEGDGEVIPGWWTD